MKRNLGVILASVFFLLFVLYGGFEAAKVVLGPSLTIISPKNLATLNKPLVTVSGKVLRAAYITIDDRQIFADQNGNIADRLLLLPGYNIITIKVRDRFGKEVSKRIELSYVPIN